MIDQRHPAGFEFVLFVVVSHARPYALDAAGSSGFRLDCAGVPARPRRPVHRTRSSRAGASEPARPPRASPRAWVPGLGEVIRNRGQLDAFGQLAGRVHRLAELALYIELDRLFQILCAPRRVPPRGSSARRCPATRAIMAARLADPGTGGAQRFRQLFRADDHQRNGADHQHFRPTEIKEHGGPACGILRREWRRLGTENNSSSAYTRAAHHRKPIGRHAAHMPPAAARQSARRRKTWRCGATANPRAGTRASLTHA